MAASVVDFGIKLYQADPEARLKQALGKILKSSYFNNSGEVWEQAVQVKTLLADNAKKFKSKNDVWPELVRRLVEDAIDKHVNADRHYKADKIQTVLDDLYTTQAVIGHAEAWMMLLHKEMKVIAALYGCGMVHVAWTGNLERPPGWWLRGPSYHVIVGFP
ncbi:hypothetical protein PRIPAC_84813 [Pristionchus pacificus]|uniref:Uncharacterized protein n=1 Tax=Pristionchus pacificus TaxID=54126 RepID=A0A2A6CEX4_PRIPA|nr:hypothetical protein PRIPAC_84813 [Pristionchus pacificus]|eukprot:PDM76638.1 hypothetical protein PRIPAC_43004 [Pristionchus pacificus]